MLRFIATQRTIELAEVDYQVTNKTSNILVEQMPGKKQIIHPMTSLDSRKKLLL